MNRLIVSVCGVAIALALAGCSSSSPKSSVNNNSSEWQQFKGKKGQDELSAEMEKQKAGKTAEAETK